MVSNPDTFMFPHFGRSTTIRLVGRLISHYFAPFELEIALESSYLVCKSAKIKIGTSKVRFGIISRIMTMIERIRPYWGYEDYERNNVEFG